MEDNNKLDCELTIAQLTDVFSHRFWQPLRRSARLGPRQGTATTHPAEEVWEDMAAASEDTAVASAASAEESAVDTVASPPEVASPPAA